MVRAVSNCWRVASSKAEAIPPFSASPANAVFRVVQVHYVHDHGLVHAEHAGKLGAAHLLLRQLRVGEQGQHAQPSAGRLVEVPGERRLRGHVVRQELREGGKGRAVGLVAGRLGVVVREQELDRLHVHARKAGDLGCAARCGHGTHIGEGCQSAQLRCGVLVDQGGVGLVGCHLARNEAREGGQRHDSRVYAANLRIIKHHQLLDVIGAHSEKLRQALGVHRLGEGFRIGELRQLLELRAGLFVQVPGERLVACDIGRQEAQELAYGDGMEGALGEAIVVEEGDQQGVDVPARIEPQRGGALVGQVLHGIGHLGGGQGFSQRGGVACHAGNVRIVFQKR